MDGNGFYLVDDGVIELNAGRPTTTMTVANLGDRPVQVGSHAHFFEVNSALRFDRDAAFGTRLDIPAGTATRFEPGQQHTVTLVEFGGARIARGLNALVNGATDSAQARLTARSVVAARGFLDEKAGPP